MPAPRILFVTEDVEESDPMSFLLIEMGAVVFTSSFNHNTLLQIKKFRPDLVVIEAGDEPTTKELLKRIKDVFPDLDVVVFTDRASVKSAMSAMNAGARRYFIKPVAAHTIMELAKEAVEKNRLKRELNLHIKQLEVHYKMAEALTFAMTPQEVAQAAVNEIVKVPGIGSAAILLFTKNNAKLKIISSDRMSEQIIERILEEENPEQVIHYSNESAWIIPLSGREDKTGHLIVVPSDHDEWEHQKVFVESVAQEIGVALERAFYQEGLKKAYQELKVAQRSLIEAEKQSAVGRLAAGLVHEIGTPLNIIAARAEYLSAMVEEDSEIARGLNTIVEQVERISSLMQQLLDFARQYPSNKELVDLKDVLAKVKELIEGSSKGGIARVELLLRQGPFRVVGTRNHLEQVFINLMINSIDAIEEAKNKGMLEGEGVIRVFAQEIPRLNKVVVTVQDNGIGIKDENKTKIFEPFFTTKAPGKGTGLGLSVVYGLVTEEGGTVEIESEWGKGTSVMVKLPTVEV